MLAVLSWLLPLLLLAAAVALPLGFTLPLIEVDRLLIFTERPSLFEMIDQLWTSDERALAAVVATFSVVLPILKLLTLFLFCFGGPGRSRRLLFLEVIAKWSMMDVMLVAIVIFTAKTSGLATAVSLPGIWFYGVAAISAAAAASLASFIARRGAATARRVREPSARRTEPGLEPPAAARRSAGLERHTASPARQPRKVLSRLPGIPTSKL